MKPVSASKEEVDPQKCGSTRLLSLNTYLVLGRELAARVEAAGSARGGKRKMGTRRPLGADRPAAHTEVGPSRAAGDACGGASPSQVELPATHEEVQARGGDC